MDRRGDFADRIDLQVPGGIARVPSTGAIKGGAWKQKKRAASQIRLQFCYARSCGGGNLVFSSPLLLGGINLAKVVDARVCLRGRSSMDHTGNGNGREHGD